MQQLQHGDRSASAALEQEVSLQFGQHLFACLGMACSHFPHSWWPLSMLVMEESCLPLLRAQVIGVIIGGQYVFITCNRHSARPCTSGVESPQSLGQVTTGGLPCSFGGTPNLLPGKSGPLWLSPGASWMNSLGANGPSRFSAGAH